MEENKNPLEQQPSDQSEEEQAVHESQPEEVEHSETGAQADPSQETQPQIPAGWQAMPPPSKSEWEQPDFRQQEPQHWYDMPVRMTPPMPPVPPTPPTPPTPPMGWRFVPPESDPTESAPAPDEQSAPSAYEPTVSQEPPMPPVSDPEPPEPFEPNRQASKKGVRVMALIVALIVAFTGSVTVGYWLGNRGLFSSQSQTPTQIPSQSGSGSVNPDGSGAPSSFDIQTGDNKGETMSYEEISAKVCPSIVNITVYAADGQKGSYASGVIMDAEKGYVVTNDHIYSGIPNAKFLITLNNGTEFRASFVSGDSRSDLAILKIENPKNLVAAEFNAQPLRVGESVLAIGQSYGYADTVTNGIVSAVNRRMNLSSGGYSERYIQTTAAINPGNSGGALVNMRGQIVGITSAKIANEKVEGLGFAIPT